VVVVEEDEDEEDVCSSAFFFSFFSFFFSFFSRFFSLYSSVSFSSCALFLLSFLLSSSLLDVCVWVCDSVVGVVEVAESDDCEIVVDDVGVADESVEEEEVVVDGEFDGAVVIVVSVTVVLLLSTLSVVDDMLNELKQTTWNDLLQRNKKLTTELRKDRYWMYWIT
jgi:hypothetical protein